MCIMRKENKRFITGLTLGFGVAWLLSFIFLRKRIILSLKDTRDIIATDKPTYKCIDQIITSGLKISWSYPKETRNLVRNLMIGSGKK